MERFVHRDIESRAMKPRYGFSTALYISCWPQAARCTTPWPGVATSTSVPLLIPSRSLTPCAAIGFVMQGLGTYAISQAAPDHVRDFWLARATEGKAIAAFALTEPDAGSDVAAIKTTARRDGDAYVIDGRKRFISNAGIADFYTVFARTGTDPTPRFLVLFVVCDKMPGSAC